MTDRTPKRSGARRRPAPSDMRERRPRPQGAPAREGSPAYPQGRPVRRPDTAPKQDTAPKKKKKKKNKFLVALKKIGAAIVTTMLSLLLVMIITGTIVATALTIYVLDFMEESTSVTFATLESGSDTYFYGTDIDEETGEEKLIVLNHIKTDVQRIPITIDKIPQDVRNAFTCTEDERFYSHDGVDYKRTFSAFLNMFLHFYDTEQGGSTITQQLIKALTGDNEHSMQRKIREIFSAMQLEKTYSKDEILEEYLNYIAFGGPVNGIQLASTRYFGKDVQDLTIPEAAVLASIPKSPEYYGPKVETYDEEGNIIVDGEANNKIRQRYVLWQMYKNGVITYDEYQEYLNTKIIYTWSPEYRELHPEVDLEELETEQKTYTWEVDAMMYEAADIVQKQFNLETQQEAIERINKGGYRIYSTTDRKMQKYVEEKMLDINNLMDRGFVARWVDLDNDGEVEEEIPHVAFVALRYDGSVMCQVGNVGPKVGSLSTSYAVTEPRQIGSTVKPITTYGLALETDLIHWGSVRTDKPIMEVNGKPWPSNYSESSAVSISNQQYNIYYFLQKSFNTVPAQLCQELTPKAVFKFATENMGMMLDPADEDYSPLSIGALSWGITLENLVNAYIPYGNLGVYNEAHIISKIEDGSHKVIYSNDGNARQAVSAETAYVMNRLLKNVIDQGTGTGARLNYKVLVGKTGTSENWQNLTFVGLTRDFVSGVTIGYREYNDSLQLPTSLHSSEVWKRIIGEYADTMFMDTPVDFERCPTVIDAPMCTSTGCIAGANCPKGITGYWKSSNAPPCDGAHYVAPDPSTVDPNAGGGGDAPADPNAGGGGDVPADPNAGGGGDVPADPNAGGGGWVDPNAGGGGDVPADPNAGGVSEW